MRSFLSKFLGADKVNEILEAYKAKNEGAEDLPVYIPKSRFDEKNKALSDAENKIKGFDKEKEDAIKAATAPLEAKLKEIPTDWQKQLSDARAALDTQKTEYEGKLAAANAEADRTAKIYGSGARNVKAVRALLDDTKPIDEQLTALKESDPYLFNSSGFGKGTGKGDDSHGGDGDDKGKGSDKLSTDAMYRAVGLVPPTNNK